MSLTTAHALFLLGTVLLYLRWRRKTSPFPLPPGPPRLPFLGNMFNFPSGGFDWEVYEQWGKKYNSDVLYLQVPGTSIVILNSLKAAKDLFERRSALYSSRPKFTFIREFLGFSWLMPFMPYGAAWKEQRRYFQRHLHPSQEQIDSGQVAQLASEYSRRLLVSLLDTPDEYLAHIYRTVCSTLQSAAYGSCSAEDNASYLAVAGEVMRALSETSIPVATLADSAPWIVPFLPRSILPPALAKEHGHWKGLQQQFRDEPFARAQGSQKDSFVSRCLEDLRRPVQGSDLAAQEEHIKDAAAIFFIGGSATTVAFMHTFVLAMLAFPECQRTAQAELDRVVGRNHLPELSDRDSLPYLSALYKEAHRWSTVGPIGIPHYLESDDVYDGYLIPGNSIVIGNAWAMLHDEVEYPDPKAFKPERFLKDRGREIDTGIRDPASIVFGFGRRICPGADIAQVIAWTQMAVILASFTISPATDEQGNVEVPKMKFRNGVTLQPEPFRCRMTPRHDGVRKLAQESEQDEYI